MFVRRLVLTSLALLLFRAGTLHAVPIATFNWRTEAQAGNFCVYGEYEDATFDVFGTPLNLGPVGNVLCTGTNSPPTITLHCEAVAGAATLSFDASVPFDGVVPPVGTPWPFVLDLVNLSGTAVAGLSDLVYTFDGVHVQRVDGFPSTTIPGCPLVGPVNVFDGTGGSNAFQSVATGTGTNVPVNSTVSFTDPATGEPRSAAVGVVFSDVSGAGSTTVTVTSSEAGSIASNFAVSVGGYNALFLDISTTATFTGPVEVCGNYDDADNDGLVDGTSVPESALRILHGEGAPLEFVDRTSSHDTEANLICASVTSLSPFVIAVDVASQSTHDDVVLPVKPLTAKIADDKTEVVKKLKVKVFNADTAPMTSHMGQLSVTASTCPESLLLNALNQPVLADFDTGDPGVTDSTLIVSGQSETAVIVLTFKAADFTSPNAKAPERCTLTLSATTIGAGTVIDPSPSNNSVRVDLTVVDNNDF